MTQLSRRSLLASLAAATAFAAWPARAAQAPAARLSSQDQGDVLQVQRYLNEIRTLQSRFQQFTQDGGVSAGTIYLQRPGKMRIVYDPPTPVLIVSDGSDVFYWDKQLQQLQQIGVEDTPAWFLLRPQIQLTGDVTVTGFRREPGVLRIAMAETAHPDRGNLTVVMSERPLELRQWTVIDPQQKQVTVMLEDPHYGVTLNPDLFVWIRQTPGAVQ
ncbi:MAG TPA: outer membrane lipoprotein carrier protein LolA [Stellaceae bacterium]|nr:outer membrane lipoprotein carrier protein LolA [Stellaceae bacterium]